MKNCFQSIMPDSLTGAILAIDGIKDGAVILNGPTGCKLYHSAISDEQFPRQLSFDPLNYPEEFYFGQPTIPCTYLDGYDYVYGSSEKLGKLLKQIKKENYNLLAVINSPGASLIGDDLNRLIKSEVNDIAYFSMESTGFSGTFNQGFENAMIEALKVLVNKRENIIPNSINIIGMSIYDKYHEGNIKEIKNLLNLCDVEVICNICAEESTKNIKNCLKAKVNVVLYPEYGLNLAKWMYEEFNIPYIMCPLPIGFENTEKFIKNICKELNKDCENFIEKLNKAKARAYLYISRYNSLTGLPKGATFSIRAKASMAYYLSKWVYSYLGMVPESIEALSDEKNEYYEKLKVFLQSICYERVLKTSLKNKVGNIVFADGNTILQLIEDKKKFTGVEISLPSLGYIHVLPKTIFGIEGSLMIIEQILNGLQFTAI